VIKVVIIDLIVAIISCSHLLAIAQTRALRSEPLTQKVTLYYNGAAELTTRENATFKREVEMNLNAMIFNGVYQDYDLKDNLIEEGYFHEGHKQGLRNQYFADRSIKLTIDFSDHDFVIWQLTNDAKEPTVVNGTGKFSLPFFYGTGTTLQPRWKQGNMEGEFQFGKRVGTWNYYDLAKNKTDEEVYEKGRFVSRTHYENGAVLELDYRKDISLSLSTLLEEIFLFDKTTCANVNIGVSGNIVYPATFKRPPTFAGGIKRLLLLLASRVPIPENTQVTVIISINEKGFVTGLDVQQGVSRQINASLLELVRGMELKFFPAIRKGKPYASTLYLPLYGGDTGIKLIEALPYDFIQEEF
jgi:antitoxin component YwqK of YwqJK toxin-antitoxin module